MNATVALITNRYTKNAFRLLPLLVPGQEDADPNPKSAVSEPRTVAIRPCQCGGQRSCLTPSAWHSGPGTRPKSTNLVSVQRLAVGRLKASPVEECRAVQILRFKADRIPVTVFFTLTIIDLIVFFTVDRTWLVFAYFLVMIPVKAIVSAWNHHHQHVPMFRHKPLNRILEMSFAFHTGVSTHAWTLHHVHGHHKNYLDQELDESRWKKRSGETYGYVPYALITAATAYPRAYAVGRNYPRLQRTFVGYGVLTLLIMGLLVATNPVSAFFLFVLSPVISLVITVAATHTHHSNLDTQDHMEASRNYTGTIRNFLTGNLGFHTAHHYRQGLHWSKLPALHASIADRIPAEYVKA